jgi:hypothetical protein
MFFSTMPGCERQAGRVGVPVGPGVGERVGLGVCEGVEVRRVDVGLGGSEAEQAVMDARSAARNTIGAAA